MIEDEKTKTILIWFRKFTSKQRCEEKVRVLDHWIDLCIGKEGFLLSGH